MGHLQKIRNVSENEENQEEREDTKHTQTITMYDKKKYHRSLSYGVLQRERERETEGNILAERTHGLFRFLNRVGKLTVVTFFGHE